MSEQLSERGRAAVSRLRKAQESALRAGLQTAEAIAEAAASASSPTPGRRPAKQADGKAAPAHVPGGKPVRA
jgi:hypothetical protein